MNRFVIFLLITGTIWAQSELDKLVLKDGSTYIGTYIRTNDNMVYFRGNDKFLAYQHPLISTLKLNDGRVLIEEGLVTKQTTINSEQYEKLTFEEKAVYIENQAAYDAKKGAVKWVLYPILAIGTFGASMGGIMKITNGGPRENFIEMIAIIGGISLGGPFYFLKQSKNTIKVTSSKEIDLYEEIYSREFKKWTFLNVTAGSVVTAGFALITLSGKSIGDRSGDIWFSPNGK